MKRIFFAFIFLLFQFQSVGQQNVIADMVEVPDRKIRYILDGKKRGATVNQFYIAEYPESVSNYKAYLKSISEKEQLFALPNEEYLSELGLNKKQIKFVTGEYYASNIYDDYPIIGLGHNQIQSYLDWKTDAVGKAALDESGIEYDPSLSYVAIVKSTNDFPREIIQVNFTLPTIASLIAAHRYFWKHKPSQQSAQNCSDSKVKSAILRSLKLKPVYCYSLSKLTNLEEIVMLESLTKLDVSSFKHKKRGKYTTQAPSRIFSTLFRVRQIKLER